MGEILAVLKRSWVSHFWTNLATTAVLTLSFSLILGAILVTLNLSRIFTVWGEEIQITVYLKDDISSEQLNALEASLKAQPGVENVQYVDKKAAAASFEKSLSSYGPNFAQSLKADNENPFPASFFVHMASAEKTPEKIEATAQQFNHYPGVEDVSYGQEWIQNYTTLLKFSRFVAFIFTFVLLIACMFTVSNSIQASLSTRREEIEILELVGATARLIRRPFLIEGAFQGFTAVILSISILGVLYKILYQNLERMTGGSQLLPALGFIPDLGLVVALLTGIAIGALGSYICVSRLNTGWAAAAERMS